MAAGVSETVTSEKRRQSLSGSDTKEGYFENAPGAHYRAERGQAATDIHGNPLVELDPVAETKLRRKIDLYIVPTVAILYLFCFIDRANIGNARLDTLEKDLDLHGYDYNTVLSIFYVGYILFEIPVTITCKWMGPGWFLPLTSLGFGIMSVCMAFVNNFSQACGVRFLLGVFEAGMMPGIAYYLSRWYRRSELTLRLSLYIVMSPLAGAFGGLLASAILKLDHFGSLHGWRMIFGIEGIITVGLALIGFLTLTDHPATARWLTQEEKDLAIARVKSERVGQTEIIDKMDAKKLKRGIFNPVVFFTGLAFLLNNITVQGLAFFAPTVVATIYPTKSIIQKQLLTVPPYIVGGFFTILMPLISRWFDRRQILIIACCPLVMVGYIMFLATENAHIRYGAAFLVSTSVFAAGPLTNSQVSANVVSDTARSSALGYNVMVGNIGGLVATWSFLPSDAPNYHIGNGINLAASGGTLVISLCLFIWMKRDNTKRELRNAEEELTGMSQQEIQDLDYKHPGFRWKP
ncbi:major facilitator superfamily domain-containing protein [Neurospora tetraspora]|uniref:Major facilitator superfamily domain-containing protein n=1 Tax=Neurospora tetraspora TaxID=94610 RepID=A0AAE0JDC0_9PEZI|nr:major facilitator superfamily domain-containing protein [Neurospora tetraspora]